MGKGGTDVAREAAHMVLLDDNFATIVHAVRHGRRLYDNIRKFIRYGISTNSAEIWTIFLAPFLGLPIPPRSLQESIFAHGMWQHMIWVGLLVAGMCLLVQAWAIQSGSAHWQTMVFTVLTLSQLAHIMAIRSERESLFVIGIFSNPAMVATIIFTFMLQMATIYVPVLNPIFRTEPLNMSELVLCLALSSVVFFAVEIEKLLVRHGWIYRGG